MTAAKKKAPTKVPGARKSLGLTAVMMLKLHPDQMAHVVEASEANYQSAAEYVRQLILADMRAEEVE